MQILRATLQVIVALGLLNVWLLRFSQPTGYRGGGAQSMRGEFAVYGLPGWFMYATGALKVGIAICLLAGLWVRSLIFPASLVLCVLMVGALAMHLKAGDPWKRFMPAIAMLTLAAALCFLATHLSA